MRRRVCLLSTRAVHSSTRAVRSSTGLPHLASVRQRRPLAASASASRLTRPQLSGHPLCTLGLVGPPSQIELVRAEHPQGGMGTVVVVLLAPVGDQDLGLQEAVELLDGQQVVAHPRTQGQRDLGHSPPPRRHLRRSPDDWGTPPPGLLRQPQAGRAPHGPLGHLRQGRPAQEGPAPQSPTSPLRDFRIW